MNSKVESKIGSTIYERIEAMNMTPAEREVAINAMHNAEMIVDATAWVMRKVEQLGALLFLRPSVKH